MTERLIWLDLETGGLDETKVPILEVGCIITEGDLIEVARYAAVISHEIVSLSQWALKQHTASGLLTQVYASTTSLAQVAVELRCFILDHDAKGAPLAGSSVHFDRKFLRHYLPGLLDLIGYRNVDVSTFKECAARWAPSLEFPTNRDLHRAIPDLEDSLAVARFFRNRLFLEIA